MEFMLLFVNQRGAPAPTPAGMTEMGRLAAALGQERKLRRGAPLAEPSEGAHVRIRNGKPFVTDGPFAEAKEFVAGFWIVDVADRAAAIDVAVRAPHARDGVVEVHRVGARHAFPDSGTGTPFLLAFHVAPGLGDPDGSKLREMLAFSEGLAREGKLIETAPLAADPPAARIEVRHGKPFVVDGPFAEAKEVVGGYGLLRVADGAEARALATRYPHAKWGAVEVREILFFDRT